MEINYFDLSGGINQSLTKTGLGLDTKNLYWADSKNVEIFENKGIKKQKGNMLLFELPETDSIISMKEMESQDVYKLVITTSSGKIYIYQENSSSLTLVNKTLSGEKVKMTPFLRGMLVVTVSDSLFYIKNNEFYEVENCNLIDSHGQSIIPDCIEVYKGRVWCSKGSTIYYSALGTYDDFTQEDDAGYINDFYTDTADITAMASYKDYLAIYKKERVYLLSGSSPDDFAIIPFADKGSYSDSAVVNVDNKQYFLSNGIYALEQVGELNQIRLGSEISKNISSVFSKIDQNKISTSIAIHYKNNHQMWFLFPFINENYFHTIWINDYVNHSWYKRVLPQNITWGTIFHNDVITADAQGKVYIENAGTTFNGEIIEFMWKSPFLSFNQPHHRKMIDEFYFVLDDNYDNKFLFSVYKDFDENYCEDRELIYSRRLNQLMWSDDEMLDDPDCFWPTDDSNVPVWSIGADNIEKAEICGSSFSVQLCVEGHSIDDNCSIIGLQFREIYNDD